VTRVAYLVSKYPAVSHTFILREVRALRELGVEVETISVRRAQASDARSEVDREELASTTWLLPLSIGRAFGLVATIATRPGAALRHVRRALSHANPGLRAKTWQVFYAVEALLLHRLLDRRGITHVHVHFANVAADVARLATEYARDLDQRRTWSFTMHGPVEFDDVTYWGLPGKAGDADLVVCISDFCRSQLMAITDESRWSRFEVVRCGIDPARFALTERAGAERDAMDVLCVGQLLPRKGQRVLLDAVARLRDRGVDVRVTLAGDGPDRLAVERAVDELGLHDRVKLLGAFGQDELAGLLAAADAFCLPSFAEGVPVSLMEAMAAGLPVVTTPIAGVPELVDASSGVLVPPGRADLLADALAELAADPARRTRMGLAGRAKVESEYASLPNARRLRELLERVADDGLELPAPRR
jgi:colanic acid/amylovoran biosynthesis glycosyltransferase